MFAVSILYCFVQILTSVSITASTPALPENYCLKYTSYTLLSNDGASLNCQYFLDKNSLNISLHFMAEFPSTLFFEAYSTDTFSSVCNTTTENPQKNCTFNLSETHKYELQLRTSLMPEGFNMLTIVEKNGQFITPYLTGDEPCHIETNPCLIKLL
uniref:Uncharacterized protein n=1 Tax=Panagrolaimus davidi TaxID=227884 RepID=A0A914QQC1_9BILA